MPDLTPERVREAIETINLTWPGSQEGSYASLVTRGLAIQADRLEREQAAEAKREKRIEELAEELFSAANPGSVCYATGLRSGQWRRAARALLDHYPSLAEAVGDE